jgi:predicted transcriptional regulator
LRRSEEGVSEQFGRNLAEARDWLGLTQGELAQRVSLVQSEIAKFEQGIRCPRLDKVVRLADAVELQVRDLLYGIE